MRKSAVVGMKPGLEVQPLLDLTKDVIERGGKIHLVSLITVGTDDDERERLQSVTTQVEEHADALMRDGYEVSRTVQISAIGLGSELASIAEREGADLLVIGLAKRSRVGKALLGSDAQSALMRAPCPVLAIRLV